MSHTTANCIQLSALSLKGSEMSICRGCGGVVGRDCYNPQECEWISRDMEMRYVAEQYATPQEAQIVELNQKVESLENRLAQAEQAIRELIERK